LCDLRTRVPVIAIQLGSRTLVEGCSKQPPGSIVTIRLGAPRSPSYPVTPSNTPLIVSNTPFTYVTSSSFRSAVSHQSITHRCRHSVDWSTYIITSIHRGIHGGSVIMASFYLIDLCSSFHLLNHFSSSHLSSLCRSS